MPKRKLIEWFSIKASGPIHIFVCFVFFRKIFEDSSVKCLGMCIYVHACASCVQGCPGQKEALDPLELELGSNKQADGARPQTWVVCKSGVLSQQMRHFPSLFCHFQRQGLPAQAGLYPEIELIVTLTF